MKTPTCFAALLLGLVSAVAVGNERTDAYRAFREHFDARRFSEALPAAQQVVTLSEKQYGPEQMELVVPLTNLGATQLRLNTYFEAEESFRRALKIVEAREGGFAIDIIRPLLGLGATYAAAGQHEDAAVQLRRALDVSRKIDGLFNPAQIEILEPLIKSYVALEQERDAEREREYALRIAEVSFGKDDVRMLPALARGARWYEEGERYFGARQLHHRSINIIAKSHGEKKSDEIKDIRMVAPLRGIARAYRMEYLYGGKVWNDDERADVPLVSTRSSVGGPQLTDEGRKSLERALEILKEAPEGTAAQRGEVLVELGDWYWTTNNEKKAFENYKEAWRELSVPGGTGTSMLETPVQIFYESPTGALHKPPARMDEFDRFVVDVDFTVTPAGKVADARVAESDATDKRKDSVVKALKDARYRPRFANGEPVETKDVRFREELYFKKKKE
jgi:tetratricopeptide (TPR) repeat protein